MMRDQTGDVLSGGRLFEDHHGHVPRTPGQHARRAAQMAAAVALKKNEKETKIEKGALGDRQSRPLSTRSPVHAALLTHCSNVKLSPLSLALDWITSPLEPANRSEPQEPLFPLGSDYLA